MSKRGVAGSLLLATCASAALGGEWIGPDLLNNDWATWSISGTGGWFKSRLQGGALQFGTFNYTVFNLTTDRTGTASRALSVEPGKRYVYEVSGMNTRGVVVPPANSEWWIELGSQASDHVGSTSWTSRSLMTVTDTGTLTLAAKGRVWASPPAEVNFLYTQHGSATVRQVVYPPQLDITPGEVRANSESPGGATATVCLTLSSLSDADEPTAWSMDWGDGMIEPELALNETHSHVYTLTDENSHTWTAVLSGENQASSAADLSTVTLLRRPAIVLRVNGVPANEGATLDVNILQNPLLVLSLTDSIGYIEETRFFIPERLDVLGPELVYMGTVFGPADIGLVFPLTVTISNTGSGINCDTVSATLAVTAQAGDMNCDGMIDFGDISPFVLALSNPFHYPDYYPNCNIVLADINGDDYVDFRDINPFVAILTGRR